MRNILVAVLLIFFFSGVQAQEKKVPVRVPLIGEDAPTFSAESTKGIINFPADYPMQWKILFSHPADFTPVCTTELLELAELQGDLKKMGVNIVVVSVDPLETHNQWIKSMEELKYKDRPTTKINFPLVADVDHVVSNEYGMIHSDSDSPKDVRGVFIIDPKDKVRSVFFYPMAVGRNMDEIKRTLIALQTADKQHVYIPANWKPGDDVIVPYIKKKNETQVNTAGSSDMYQVSWYLNFKKAKE